MKKIIIALLITLSISSCNFLDVVPDDTATLKDAFKNELTTEAFVYACYGYLPNSQDFRNSMSWFTSNDMVGAYHWGSQWFNFLRYQLGEDNSSATITDFWGNYYQAIRQCYIFLNNVDNVSPVAMPQSEFEARKKMWKGEIHFLIAYYHFLLLRDYGPIVIVKEEIPIESNISYPRSSFDECVEEIAAMFDRAIDLLPTTVQTSDYGRATKLVAQSFKSKMYLIAASPLFNGNTDYASFKNKDGKQLISQTYDKNKWKKAMDETLIAINMAHANGFDLYQYKDRTFTNAFDQAVATARYTMIDTWSKNKELIWAYTGYKETAGWGNSMQRHAIIKGLRSSSTPVGALGVTLTAAKIFHTKNGLPPEQDPTFSWANRMQILDGDSTIQLHRNREPRFYAFVGYDRGEYEVNGDKITLYLRYGERSGCQIDQRNTDHLYSGYALKKGIDPDAQVTANTFTFKTYPFPLMRLGELYLNYAEACAEYSGKFDTDAENYFNLIRKKAGIPSLTESYGNITGETLVKAVRRERMIEFIFEGHWFYDLKRWKEAIKWYEKDKEGMEGLNEIGASATDFYKESRMDARKLLFSQKHYLLPISTSYVNINQHLVQNPLW